MKHTWKSKFIIWNECNNWKSKLSSKNNMLFVVFSSRIKITWKQSKFEISLNWIFILTMYTPSIWFIIQFCSKNIHIRRSGIVLVLGILCFSAVRAFDIDRVTFSNVICSYSFQNKILHIFQAINIIICYNHRCFREKLPNDASRTWTWIIF